MKPLLRLGVTSLSLLFFGCGHALHEMDRGMNDFACTPNDFQEIGNKVNAYVRQDFVSRDPAVCAAFTRIENTIRRKCPKHVLESCPYAQQGILPQFGVYPAYLPPSQSSSRNAQSRVRMPYEVKVDRNRLLKTLGCLKKASRR